MGLLTLLLRKGTSPSRMIFTYFDLLCLFYSHLLLASHTFMGTDSISTYFVVLSRHCFVGSAAESHQSSLALLPCLGADACSPAYLAHARYPHVGSATKLVLSVLTFLAFSEKCSLGTRMLYATPADGCTLLAPISISFIWTTLKIVIFFTYSVFAFPFFTITMLTNSSNANTSKSAATTTHALLSLGMLQVGTYKSTA